GSTRTSARSSGLSSPPHPGQRRSPPRISPPRSRDLPATCSWTARSRRPCRPRSMPPPPGSHGWPPRRTPRGPRPCRPRGPRPRTSGLGRGAALEHYRLQELAPRAIAFDTLSATLAEEASYRLFGIATGALSSRSTLAVQLAGERAELTLAVLSLGDRQQVLDVF